VFSLAPGGGRRDGEDAMVATRREIYEATGLRDLELEAEVWHRRAKPTCVPPEAAPGVDQGIDGRDIWMRRSRWGHH
jgi:8-oxo-dGTP pyrophosphatase MutT (NUDIX family)